MDKISVIRNELTADPLGIGYSGMTHSEAAAALNTANRTRVAETYANAKTILAHLGSTAGSAFLDGLEAAASSNRAVYWVLSFIKSDGGVNVGDPETRAALDALAAGGVLETASVTAVKALAEQTVSRGEELGIGPVYAGEVEAARA